MIEPTWSVITVTYNSERDIQKHWRGRRGSREYTWIVVDNGSVDGTLQLAREEADIVIESGGNIGFSRANNLGLKRVSTDYVAFINPDVDLPQSGWESELSRVIDRTGAFVAPQLLNPDGSPQANARGLPFFWSKILHRIRPESRGAVEYARAEHESASYCAWAMGAAVAGRTDLVRNFGGWNDQFFLYYEDHEFGLRAWENSIPIIIEPSVAFVHDWRRATSGPNLRAWRAELASMSRFYRMYPELISRLLLRRRRERRFADLYSHLWDPVIASTAEGAGR